MTRAAEDALIQHFLPVRAEFFSAAGAGHVLQGSLGRWRWKDRETGAFLPLR